MDCYNTHFAAWQCCLILLFAHINELFHLIYWWSHLKYPYREKWTYERFLSFFVVSQKYYNVLDQPQKVFQETQNVCNAQSLFSLMIPLFLLRIDARFLPNYIKIYGKCLIVANICTFYTWAMWRADRAYL